MERNRILLKVGNDLYLLDSSARARLYDGDSMQGILRGMEEVEIISLRELADVIKMKEEENKKAA